VDLIEADPGQPSARLDIPQAALKEAIVGFIGISHLAEVPVVIEVLGIVEREEVTSQGSFAGLTRARNEAHLPADGRTEANALEMTFNHMTILTNMLKKSRLF